MNDWLINMVWKMPPFASREGGNHTDARGEPVTVLLCISLNKAWAGRLSRASRPKRLLDQSTGLPAPAHPPPSLTRGLKPESPATRLMPQSSDSPPFPHRLQTRSLWHTHTKYVCL